jgi:hypothetical protein
MPKYNKMFELSVEDMELIEEALRDKQRELTLSADNVNSEPCETLKGTHDLLGRLHNQKTFYRPKSGAYLGG